MMSRKVTACGGTDQHLDLPGGSLWIEGDRSPEAIIAFLAPELIFPFPRMPEQVIGAPIAVHIAGTGHRMPIAGLAGTDGALMASDDLLGTGSEDPDQVTAGFAD